VIAEVVEENLALKKRFIADLVAASPGRRP
jgi:hypothetical protein